MRDKWVNRITAGMSIGLLIVLATALGMLAGGYRSDLARRPSTFFTDESGARGLLLVMQRLFPGSSPWRKPMFALPDEVGEEQTNAPGTLIVAGPAQPLSPNEAAVLLQWVARGGQLILCTEDGWKIEPRSKARNPKARDPGVGAKGDTIGPGPETLLSRVHLSLARPVPAKTNEASVVAMRILRPDAEPDNLGRPGAEALETLAVFLADNGVWQGQYTPLARVGTNHVAVEVRHGTGRIVALGDPGFVSNRALGSGDNAVWLVRLCAAWKKGPVWFDEYHHGFGTETESGELAGRFLQTPWGWCFLQWLLAGGLYAQVYRRRIGRIMEPPPAGLPQVTDLVEARGSLFHAASSQRLAADLLVQHLCFQMGSNLTHPENLVQFCQQQRRQPVFGPGEGLFSELEQLYLGFVSGRAASEARLCRLGQVAGLIHHELGHEH
jgi:hypothetical protein